jgi:hypothetical protein
MDPNKQPNETDNCLEFILNTLCNSLNLKPKQAAGLLTNGNQYLIHASVRGLKGNYEPIISWFQEVYSHSKHLSDLMIESENANIGKALLTTMNGLKSGLYSLSRDVISWCARLMGKIAFDFATYDQTQSGKNDLMLEAAWRWFGAQELEKGGVEACLNAIIRHSDLAD